MPLQLPHLDMTRPDVKRMLQGCAVAAASGLLLGAVAHPNLRGEREAQGPQMLMPGGGARGVQLVSDTGVGAYAGQPPEYVVGTDWTRPRPEAATWQAADAGDHERDASAYEPQTSPVIYDDPERMPTSRTPWRDEPRAPPMYPSARGAPYLDSDLPPPPSGPDDDEPLDDDAG